MKKLKSIIPVKNEVNEVLDISEYFCDCCEIKFYADYGIVERCPNCGSTSEVDMVADVKLEVKKRWKTA